ncbi:MAG TPA: Stk1 family PASTA domain-containing Ser/Thr kinase [Clostridia bacterium]|nr:Stk1 family PASTA domain-containing Ser/Thr kinase [Clostridia bacterium]
MIGKKFDNRYEIQEILGSGGMSVVYKGLDTLLNRLVTIKVLRDQYAHDEDFVRRFHREAQSVASLSHINIVSIFDVGIEEGLHYLVMEFVEGQNLKEYIRDKGKLPVQEAVPIAIQILDALEHAHEHGVVHRDIKPHNILLTKQGRVKVTDFGIARAASETTLTYTGTIVGSVHYISPEQAKGITIGSKSDLYSAGAVLYEMVTGQLPFTGDSPIAIALQHIQNEPVPPNELVQKIPKELSHIILRAMEKSPEARYSSAREMRYDLEKIYQGKAHEINMITNDRGTNEDTVEIPTLRSMGESRYEDAPPRRKKRLKPGFQWALLGAGILLFILILWGGYALLAGYLNVGKTTVPDVEGKPLIEAKAELEEAGLKYTVEYNFSSTVKKDHVISQTVAPNQLVKKNRVVGLLVSEGPKNTRVPNLVGKTRREAEVEINNSNLEIDIVEEYSDNVPVGIVISQNPDARKEIPENSVVTVVVSLGREPKYISMPNLVGSTLEEAKKTLAENGLKLGTAKEQESDEYFAWQVISQDIVPETLIPEGETVNLVYSSGPGPMAQIARVTYEIPHDGQEHRLRILVSDIKGEHYEYDQIHQPGDIIVQDIPFYGNGKIGIYLDAELVFSQNVP